MKFLIGVAAATLLMAAPALAQTPTDVPEVCTGFAAAPTFPDGATAEPDALAAADQQFQAWHNAGAAKLGQCRAEIEATRARLATMEAAHNQAVGVLNGGRDAWAAEVEEYNARAPRNRRGR